MFDDDAGYDSDDDRIPVRMLLSDTDDDSSVQSYVDPDARRAMRAARDIHLAAVIRGDFRRLASGEIQFIGGRYVRREEAEAAEAAEAAVGSRMPAQRADVEAAAASSSRPAAAPGPGPGPAPAAANPIVAAHQVVLIIDTDDEDDAPAAPRPDVIARVRGAAAAPLPVPAAAAAAAASRPVRAAAAVPAAASAAASRPVPALAAAATAEAGAGAAMRPIVAPRRAGDASNWPSNGNVDPTAARIFEFDCARQDRRCHCCQRSIEAVDTIVISERVVRPQKQQRRCVGQTESPACPSDTLLLLFVLLWLRTLFFVLCCCCRPARQSGASRTSTASCRRTRASSATYASPDTIA